MEVGGRNGTALSEGAGWQETVQQLKAPDKSEMKV
jgi:hypothetical protein